MEPQSDQILVNFGCHDLLFLGGKTGKTGKTYVSRFHLTCFRIKLFNFGERQNSEPLQPLPTGSLPPSTYLFNSWNRQWGHWLTEGSQLDPISRIIPWLFHSLTATALLGDSDWAVEPQQVGCSSTIWKMSTTSTTSHRIWRNEA